MPRAGSGDLGAGPGDAPAPAGDDPPQPRPLARGQGRIEEGLELVREAVEIYEELHHPDLATALATYGGLLSRAGRTDEAVAMGRRAVELSTRSLGAEHRYTIMQGVDLATMLIAAERWAEAETLLRDALEREEHNGGGSLISARIDSMLAQIALADDRIDDAVGLYRAASQEVIEAAGPGAPHLHFTVFPLIGVLAEHGRHREAIAELEEIEAGLPEEAGSLHQGIYEHQARQWHALEGRTPRVDRLIARALEACAELEPGTCTALKDWGVEIGSPAPAR